MNLKDSHSWQAWAETEQKPVDDQEDSLHDNKRLVSQKVGQQEHRNEDGEIGVCPYREQIVGQLWKCMRIIQ